MSVLLIGFEGYGGRGINPAAETAKALDGETVGGQPVEGRVLPVRFEGLAEAIRAHVHEMTPRLVICLGLWPGEPVIRLEHVAFNNAEFEIPDNTGALMKDEPLRRDGPTALQTTLPVSHLVDALRAQDVPARPSFTAGSFLCNATLYFALEAAGELASPPRTGFVHLPYLPAQVAMLMNDLRAEARLELHQRADLASMALEDMTRALRIIIAESLEQNR